MRKNMATIMEDKKTHFVIVRTYDNYLLANMTLGLLEENNIVCHLKDENIVTIDPFLSPAIGGIKLMVEEKAVGYAKEIIAQAEAAYLKEIPCPVCKTNNLSFEEKTTVPAGLWQKIKNIFLFGQSGVYQKKYLCSHCKSIFTELPSAIN